MVDRTAVLPLVRDGMFAQPRDRRLDAARGAAMALVVLGHALIGVMAAGAETRALRALLITLYAAHIPLFFILAGVLARGGAARPWGALAGRLARRLGWPYLLWGLLLYSAHFLMSGYTNTALAAYAPWRILWQPPAVMWFLPVLALGLVLVRALAPAGRVALVAVGAAVLLAPYLWPALPQGLRFAGLVPLGAALGLPAPGRAGLALLAAAVMAGTAALAWAQAAAPLAGYPAFAPAYLPALVAGPVLLAWLAGQNRLLAAIGRHSMAVFCCHVLITAGTRIGLAQAGLGDPALAVALGTGLGLALPVLAARWAGARGWDGALGWR